MPLKILKTYAASFIRYKAACLFCLLLRFLLSLLFRFLGITELQKSFLSAMPLTGMTMLTTQF